MRKSALVMKFDANGNIVLNEKFVKYKGKYIPESNVPKRVRRTNVNLSFYKDVLSRMSKHDALKAEAYLRLI